MAKYVIDIDEKTYNDIKEENGIYVYNALCARITGKVVGAIQSATPLEEYCDSCPYQPTESEDD